MTAAQANSEPLPPDDDGLVLQAKTDREALGALFDRYYSRVFRYCWRRLGDREVAEDVTSEIFLQVASHLRSFEGQTETDFRRWLFRIATNAIAAHGRQTQRRTALWQTATHRGQLELASPENSLTAAHDRLDWPLVQAAIGELNEREQTIVSLRFFAGCSHEEIADVIGTTTGAVRTALSRALAQLRDKLGSLRSPD